MALVNISCQLQETLKPLRVPQSQVSDNEMPGLFSNNFGFSDNKQKIEMILDDLWYK